MTRTPAQRLLQQLARFPEPGLVKTRLQPELSAAQACETHIELLQHTARCLLSSELGPVELWMDSELPHPAIRQLLSEGIDQRCLQSAGDLGHRMYAALEQGLARAGQVLLVGSDCPVLSRDYLASAFALLAEVDVVLGAAEDGGFVLIACRSLHPTMFEKIAWGTHTVLANVLSNLSAADLSYRVLPELYDVDTYGDFLRWRTQSPAQPAVN